MLQYTVIWLCKHIFSYFRDCHLILWIKRSFHQSSGHGTKKKKKQISSCLWVLNLEPFAHYTDALTTDNLLIMFCVCAKFFVQICLYLHSLLSRSAEKQSPQFFTGNSLRTWEERLLYTRTRHTQLPLLLWKLLSVVWLPQSLYWQLQAGKRTWRTCWVYLTLSVYGIVHVRQKAFHNLFLHL